MYVWTSSTHLLGWVLSRCLRLQPQLAHCLCACFLCYAAHKFDLAHCCTAVLLCARCKVLPERPVLIDDDLPLLEERGERRAYTFLLYPQGARMKVLRGMVRGTAGTE